MPDKISWKLWKDLMHRKEKPKREKKGKNFEIQDPYLEVVFEYFTWGDGSKTYFFPVQQTWLPCVTNWKQRWHAKIGHNQPSK